MKQRRVSPTLGLGYMILGAFFLISPYFAVVDVLPDFIGYAFILKGLYCLSDMNDRIEEAFRLFRRLLILSCVRVALLLLIFGMAAPAERPTMQLLCCFVMAVLDCMAIIPAWKHLSGGLIYLGTRHEGKAVFDKCYPGGEPQSYRSLTERTFSFTTVFLVVREILSVLPELTVLSHSLGGAEMERPVGLYDYIGLLRGVSAAIVLVFGVIWLFKFIRYFCYLLKDRPFFENLRQKYEAEVLTRPELFARRGVKCAMIFLCVALVFTFDLFLDDVCVTPDFLFGILSIVALLILRKYIKTPWWGVAMVMSVLYIPLTACEWLMQIFYFRFSEGASAYRRADVYYQWLNMNVVRAVTLIVGIILTVLLVKVLGEVVRRYTGFSVTAHDSASPSERVREVHKDLCTRLWVAFGLFVLASAVSQLYMAVLPVMENTLWELVGLADFVMTGVFVAFFIHTVTVIFEQIDYKYMLS